MKLALVIWAEGLSSGFSTKVQTKCTSLTPLLSSSTSCALVLLLFPLDKQSLCFATQHKFERKMKIMSRADLGLPVCQDHETEHKKQEDCRLTSKQVPGANQQRQDDDRLATNAKADTLHLRFATLSLSLFFFSLFSFFSHLNQKKI
jgi:hypothetical protein